MDFLIGLRSKNPLLYKVAVAHFGAFGVFLILLLIGDHRVMGINAWIKPMKYALSIGTYLLTFCWILHMVRGAKTAIKVISWGVAVTMTIVMVLVTVQAGRGVRSHFNLTSLTNILIYGGILLALFFNVIFNIWTLILLYASPAVKSKIMLLAARSGFWIFIIGMLAGGVMVANFGHSIGMSDGGSGLPFVNWSVESGDLRVPHFFGLLALQLLPVSTLFLEKFKVVHSLRWLAGLTVLYLLFVIWVFYLSMSGMPFITMM